MLNSSSLVTRLQKGTELRTMSWGSYGAAKSPISSTTWAGTMAFFTVRRLKFIGASIREILMCSMKYPSCCIRSAFEPRLSHWGTSVTNTEITGCIFRNCGKEKYAATAAIREPKTLKNRLIPSIPPSGVI